MTTENLNINELTIRRSLRNIAKGRTGWRNNLPIHIIEGDIAPRVVGRGFYYTNKSGDLIRYPNAYQKAWGKPIYHKSTIRIEVGKDYKL